MPKSYPRSDRLADAIMRELSQAIRHEMADPRVAWVTLSAVRMTPDLATALVYFTVLDDKVRLDAEKALEQGSGFLRTLVAKKLQTRKMPRLKFIYDATLEYANHMNDLINEALNNQNTYS